MSGIAMNGGIPGLPVLLLLLLLLLLLRVAVPAVSGEDGDTVSAAGIALAAQIDRMDVEHLWTAGKGVDWRTGRVDPASRGHGTHCSAFAAAFCAQQGIYILRPPEHSQVLLANAQYEWLEQHGKEFGWVPVASGAAAQSLANRGWVVVAVCRNVNPRRPGHIAVVRPGVRTAEEQAAAGPLVAQAGTVNRGNIPLAAGFRNHRQAWINGEIRFFAHRKPPEG